MESHEYGFKIISRHNGKFYIYPNCKESLLTAINAGYKLEYDTNEISDYGHHKIWIPYDDEVSEISDHFTCYRIIPKEDK